VTTRLNLAWLTHGGVGVVSVVGHVAGRAATAEMVKAVDGGISDTAIRIHRELLPSYAPSDEVLAGRDHGQGRAAPRRV
jgi:dihydrodipicolinate synthase/N-acetylneuraminate lyase